MHVIRSNANLKFKLIFIVKLLVFFIVYSFMEKLYAIIWFTKFYVI